MPELIDPDTSPPVLATREDCENPSACVCGDDDFCHHMRRQEMLVPAPRTETENPPRDG